MADNCCSACSAVLPAQGDDDEVVTEAERWTPDAQLVPAILAGAPVRMANLGDNDRAWVVAGLTVAGLSAPDINDRLKCSLRLVRAILALPLTKACLYAHTETDTWIKENQLLQGGLRRRDAQIEALAQELDRTQGKLTRLLDAHIVGTSSCRRCGTPWDKGNTYFENGKRRCRNCNRLKQQRFRDRQRERAVEQLAGVFEQYQDVMALVDQANEVIDGETCGYEMAPLMEPRQKALPPGSQSL